MSSLSVFDILRDKVQYAPLSVWEAQAESFLHGSSVQVCLLSMRYGQICCAYKCVQISFHSDSGLAAFDACTQSHPFQISSNACTTICNLPCLSKQGDFDFFAKKGGSGLLQPTLAE